MTDKNSTERTTSAKAADKAFLKLIMPSVLGILLCMICLASMTWAWFAEDVGAGGTTLVATNFEVENVVIKEKDGETVASDATLENNKIYTVTVKTNGTENTIGYLRITLQNVSWTISKPHGFQGDFTFEVATEARSGPLTVEALWGNLNSAVAIGDEPASRPVYYVTEGSVTIVDAALIETETETETVTETETAKAPAEETEQQPSEDEPAVDEPDVNEPDVNEPDQSGVETDEVTETEEKAPEQSETESGTV